MHVLLSARCFHFLYKTSSHKCFWQTVPFCVFCPLYLHEMQCTLFFIRDGSKFMGYAGRDHRQEGEDFFSKKIWGEKPFFRQIFPKTLPRYPVPVPVPNNQFFLLKPPVVIQNFAGTSLKCSLCHNSFDVNIPMKPFQCYPIRSNLTMILSNFSLYFDISFTWSIKDWMYSLHSKYLTPGKCRIKGGGGGGWLDPNK